MPNDNSTGLLLGALVAVGGFLLLSGQGSGDGQRRMGGGTSFGFNPTVAIREQFAGSGQQDARENRASSTGAQTAADTGGRPGAATGSGGVTRGSATKSLIENSGLVSGSVEKKETGTPPGVDDANPPQSIYPTAVEEATGGEVQVKDDLTTPGGQVSSIEEDFSI